MVQVEGQGKQRRQLGRSEALTYLADFPIRLLIRVELYVEDRDLVARSQGRVRGAPARETPGRECHELGKLKVGYQ
jgi:hypothetical protein